MRCQVIKNQVENARKRPCVVCRNGTGNWLQFYGRQYRFVVNCLPRSRRAGSSPESTDFLTNIR